jgi:hypothetical protein
LQQGSAVTINGVVYCGGHSILRDSVVQYNPVSEEWTELSRPPVRGFAMASFNDQLVLAGCDAKIRAWDDGSREWLCPYPPMRTEHGLAAAVGYHNYLIVACGFQHKQEVDVLDSSSGTWFTGQQVPMGGHAMSSVVVDDRWYLSSFGGWKDETEHIFWAHLPTLTTSATSAQTTIDSIWYELPMPPVVQPSLLALQGHLLVVGGGEGYIKEIYRYDTETSQWRECGQLPVGMGAHCCALLPSGELMVAGGVTGNTRAISKRTWTGKIQS